MVNTRSTDVWETDSESDAPLAAAADVSATTLQPSSALKTFAAELLQASPCQSTRDLAKRANTFRALGILQPAQNPHSQLPNILHEPLSVRRQKRLERRKLQHSLSRITQRKNITEAIVNYRPVMSVRDGGQKAFGTMRKYKFALWEQDRDDRMQQQRALSASHHARRRLVHNPTIQHWHTSTYS